MGEDVTLDLTSRLRLELASEAAGLADLSRGLVRTDSDGRPGSATEHAARMLARAQEALALAVAYDRRVGASWGVIGESLGEVSEQAAHERFAPEAARYEEDLLRGWLLAGVPRRPFSDPDGLTGNPVQTAEMLDEWMARRTDDGGHPSRRPVSGALEPMGNKEFGSLLAAALAMIIKSATDPWARADERHRMELGYARRRVEWHERMIAEETAAPGRSGSPIQEHQALLKTARARLTELEQSTDRESKDKL